jgi:Encapsulating protein for peroxidase
MDNNLGHDKIPQWTADTWNSIDKALADEHELTAIGAKFLTPPVPDSTMDGTVAADTVFTGNDGVLSVDESENRSIVEIAVQFKVRKAQVDNEAQMKTTESLATRAANLLARAEDLLIFQGFAALDDPLFKSKAVILIIPNPSNSGARVDSFLFPKNSQTITVEPAEVNSNPALSIYGENTYAAVAQGYATLQEHHYGRQALVLPTAIYADTYATRTTTLDIPAITADRIKGLIGDRVYGTSTLPALNGSSPAKGVLLALDGNTMDLVVQMNPTVEVVTQDPVRGDYVFKVYERFALRLKDTNAVVELDFVSKKTKAPKE